MKNNLTFFERIVKRSFDLLFSIIGIIMTASIILIAFLIASIETRSSGFFIQERVGKNGKIIKVIKIKTMKDEKYKGSTVTTSRDARITICGRFFRKTKIDELPQLLNVLKGDMSFVGPRPDVPGYADTLTGEDRIILTIRPGITGPASLKYKNEEQILANVGDPEWHNDHILFPDKVKLNVEYVRNYDFLRDINYILKTILGEKRSNDLEPKRIFLSTPHMSGNEQKYIDEAFKTNWIAPLGKNVDEFEKEVAKYSGTTGAAAMTSGTAAIHIALELLDVRQGDIVFCSSLTFVASANPILYLGGEPVFVDSEYETWNMSPVALTRAMEEAQLKGKLPKAVVIVNLYGQSAKMDELMAICDSYGVPVIEDAAESLGSYYKGKKSGSFGKFGIFSFNGNKIITTSGGGMLVSDDDGKVERARFLATQAREKARHYQHQTVGYNYRMSNILAGIGRAQLEVLDDRVKARRAVFARYEKSLGGIEGVSLMPELAGTYSNRWLTAMELNPELLSVTVNELIDALEVENIEARPVWKPLHMQPLFAGCKFYPHAKDEIVSERLFARGICLPSGSNMTVKEQERVISVIRKKLQ